MVPPTIDPAIIPDWSGKEEISGLDITDRHITELQIGDGTYYALGFHHDNDGATLVVIILFEHYPKEASFVKSSLGEGFADLRADNMRVYYSADAKNFPYDDYNKRYVNTKPLSRKLKLVTWVTVPLLNRVI